MKVSEGRCGNKSEAKPVPGQTCPIEPADGAPAVRKKDMTVAIDIRRSQADSCTALNLTASTTVKTCFSLDPQPRVPCYTNLER